MYSHYLKRPISFAMSLLGLILLSWLYLILMIAIKLDSPGPVLFRQKRVGKDQTYFNILKFRTMRVDTPHDVPTHLLEDPEQYITRVGRFLRKTSLDELPQLFNILKGDMDVIGPRPALWNQYDLIAEREKYGANDIRPGLTGWAQIHGRDELEIAEKARLDGWYVQHESFLLDAVCFLGTIAAVLRHEGVVEGGVGGKRGKEEQRAAKSNAENTPKSITQKKTERSSPHARCEGRRGRVLILANHYQTVRIFRRDLMKALSAAGYTVILSIPACDAQEHALLESYGCRVVFISSIERRGRNPLQDLKLIVNYRALIRKVRPDMVLTYTVKPNIYGAWVCKREKIPCCINVTGLGTPFQSRNLTRLLVSAMYRVSCSRVKVVFFENEENRDVFVRDRIVRREQTAVLNGAGVNLEEFGPCPYPAPEVPLTFLFVGRIMTEKGVDELFAAIPRVKEAYPDARFWFLGWYEDDYKDQVAELEAAGLIRYFGFVQDVKPYMAQAHCVILPSWHEGMSNTLLEGAAMCRPLITNRIHGCMEAVIEGETGFLAEKQDVDSLYEKMMQFAALPHEKKKNMGECGRVYMQEKFDKKKVIAETMRYMGL